MSADATAIFFIRYSLVVTDCAIIKQSIARLVRSDAAAGRLRVAFALGDGAKVKGSRRSKNRKKPMKKFIAAAAS